MGFFSNSTSRSESSYDIFGESYDDSQVALFEDYDFEAAYDEYIMEYNEAKLDLVNGIINYENRCFSEGMMTDEEIYTEGVLGSIWDKLKALGNKIKEFIKKIWAKFTIWFNGTFKSNAEFWKKYSKKIQVAIAKLDSDWEVTLKFNLKVADTKKSAIEAIFGGMDKFTTDTLKTAIKNDNGSGNEQAIDNINEYISKQKEYYKDTLDSIEDDVFDSTDYKASDVKYGELEGALKNNKAIKEAEKAKTKLEKALDKSLKDVEKAFRDAASAAEKDKNNPIPTTTKSGFACLTIQQGLAGRSMSLYMRIVKGTVSTYRTLAMKVLSGAASADYKNKTE